MHYNEFKNLKKKYKKLSKQCVLTRFYLLIKIKEKKYLQRVFMQTYA